MSFHHPIGDDHPFRAVHALATAQGYDPLEIVDVYDGALIRLFCTPTNMVFKLNGDPGSAMDRQRFDYSEHIRIKATTPAAILDEIKAHIARGKKPETRPGPIGKGHLR